MTGRISIDPSVAVGSVAAHFSPSSRSAHCASVKPPNCSLISAAGPSVSSTSPFLTCKVVDAEAGCTGAQSAPVSVIPGVVFSGSVDGHMRAYSTKDGSILWDFNTVREYETVNHVPAKGGSIDGAGPAIADGLVVTNSGYSLWRGIAGNVLLAFSAK